MFKKLVITLMTATTIFSGIAAINATVSRQNSATEITTETETNNRKLDYSAEHDYSYADAFVGDIVDWNTNGEELSLMTSDGYEFYAYKSKNEYDFNKAYVALDDITDVEKTEGKIRIYTKDGTIYQVFGE
ncbi:hypothetical protein LI205_03295 [bacterium MSK18_59]|nr:hypothetical protein [bacterium MSK18_59]